MADIQDYKVDLQDRLHSLATPDSLPCRNPHCSDSAHSDERDIFVLDILCSVIEASHTRIPMAGGRRATPQANHSKTVKQGVSGSIPGWNEEVEPFRQEALFWHAIWKSCAKPNTGDIHRKMTQSRNQYHYAVRRAKIGSDLTKAKKLFEASLSSDIDLLKEMKNIRKGKGQDDNVAGANGEEDIVEKFRLSSTLQVHLMSWA